MCIWLKAYTQQENFDIEMKKISFNKSNLNIMCDFDMKYSFNKTFL